MTSCAFLALLGLLPVPFLASCQCYPFPFPSPESGFLLPWFGFSGVAARTPQHPYPPVIAASHIPVAATPLLPTQKNYRRTDLVCLLTATLPTPPGGFFLPWLAFTAVSPSYAFLA